MKSTKIIAGLGVVAALGVAALPFGAFAADRTAVSNKATTTAQASSDDADVTVQVMVDDTIAIRITGSEKIWTWDETESKWVVSDQTDQKDFDGVADIEGPITSIEMVNNDLKTLNNNVYVTTNSTNGYKLYVKANDNAALRHYTNNTVDSDAMTNTNKNIPAAGELEALAKGTAKWGLRAANSDENGTVAANFADAAKVTGAALDASGNGALVYTSDGKAYDADLTTITYGVATSGTQASGLYQASLTYTAAVQE